MNAHHSRWIFSRQNAAPFAILFLLAVIVVCGLTAGTGQSSAEASVGDGRGNQLPPEFSNRNPEDVKKDFNDDDLKVKEQKKLRGQWDFGLVPDMDQFNDASTPVVVGAIQSLSGGGKYAGVVKVKRVEIKNRSPRAVNSVQLRVKITSLDNPLEVLLEDTIPFVNFWAEANSSKVIEIPTLYPVLLFKPLAKDGELNGRFKLTLGVQEARFADGSFWRRQEPVVWLDILYYDQPVANRFPLLASVLPIFPSLWVDPGRSRVIFRPCEAKPRSSASAFSSMPFQETTCQDNMSTRVDPHTGAQSCGTPTPGAACYSNCNGEWCTVDVVPGGRCSPTPTPTPSPTPIPCEQPRPAFCCEEAIVSPGAGAQDYCVWSCVSSCPPNWPLGNGCFTPLADGSCPPGYEFSLGDAGPFGGQCCPQVAGGGCEWGICDGGSHWDAAQCCCAGNTSGSCDLTPVLIDVSGDGFALTDARGGVPFDLDGDGRPERLSWTQAGSDDAWLALDRDGDGAVEDGSELFGNFTPQPPPPAGQGRNGFLALAEFDRTAWGGNSDGVIDARDAVFTRLRLWRDSDHDGVSRPAELHAPASLGVARLHLNYKESRRTDEFGNRFRYRAKVDDARGSKVNRWAWDVFLVRAP